MTINIQSQYDHIQTLIQEYEAKYCRPQGSVRFVAVSKHQSIEKIREAYEAGQRAFAENYLQEALIKMESLQDLLIEWHFIGKCQRNKTKAIATHFAWVHSIDNALIAKRLSDHRPAYLPPLNICIQINTSQESEKSGIAITETHTLAKICRELPRLTLRGLMCIPAHENIFAQQRNPYHQLFLEKDNLIKENFSLDTLSMGMSGDMEAAIAEGSTILRLGTLLFGSR